MSNRKFMIVHLIVRLIFQNRMNHLVEILTLELTCQIMRQKTDIKNISHVGTSGFVLISNIANLKTEVGKLDVAELVPVLVDLSKLSEVVKIDVVKKIVHVKLVTKVNSIDASAFVF